MKEWDEDQRTSSHTRERAQFYIELKKAREGGA